MKRPPLEATALVLLARLQLKERQPAAAAESLSGIRLEPLGPELQAQVHYWRAEAAAALGHADASERAEAKRLLAGVQAGVPPELRVRFLSRPDRQALAN
jgi:outer membrane PBP1 activator LpoA protein